MALHKLALIAALVAGPCSNAYVFGQQKVSRMKKNQVLWVARQVAVKNGFRLKDYMQLKARFDAKEKQWTVVLDHKPPPFPGSRSLIKVDDRTGKARLLRGR